jgi:hypothetical protein
MSDKDEQKTLKKLVKAEAKTAKKTSHADIQSAPAVSSSEELTPAERSAAAAEKQLVLHRWKVIFAGVSALIALVTLVILLLR